MNGIERLSESSSEAVEPLIEEPSAKEMSDKKEGDFKEENVVEEKTTSKVSEKDILNKEIKTSFTTRLGEPESNISKENYQKYNEIINYLNDYPDIEKEILF